MNNIKTVGINDTKNQDMHMVKLLICSLKNGWPKDINILFSVAELAADFENYEPSILEEIEIILDEGTFHKGKGSVIRFVGRKPLPE